MGARVLGRSPRWRKLRPVGRRDDAPGSCPGQITTAGRIAFVYRDDYLGGALFMALPSGRLLTYPRPRWRDVDILDKDKKPTGEKRHELSFRRAHGRAKLWHGTLCENAVQAAAADILRQTVTRIETNPALAFMPIRMTTHDEIVCEVDEARAEEAKAILRREMLTLPDWAAGLPLQSEESSLSLVQQRRKRCCDERPLPPSHPAFVSAARRNLALRARRGVFDRAAWRRQRRCRTHGACRADPRSAAPARPGHRAEARRHDRMAAGDRVLAAPAASARRRSQRNGGMPASTPRAAADARDYRDWYRSRALAGHRARRLCGRSPALRHADHRRDLAPQGPKRQARPGAGKNRRALSDALGPDRHAAPEFEPGSLHAGRHHHRWRVVGPRLCALAETALPAARSVQARMGSTAGSGGADRRRLRHRRDDGRRRGHARPAAAQRRGDATQAAGRRHGDLPNDGAGVVRHGRRALDRGRLAADRNRQAGAASNGFLYDAGADDPVFVHSLKIDWLRELVESLDGEPLLIAYEFVEDLRTIRRAFGDVPALGGATPAGKRRSWSRPGTRERCRCSPFIPPLQATGSICSTADRGWRGCRPAGRPSLPSRRSRESTGRGRPST